MPNGQLQDRDRSFRATTEDVDSPTMAIFRHGQRKTAQRTPTVTGISSLPTRSLVNSLTTHSLETTGDKDMRLVGAHTTLNMGLLDVIAFKLVWALLQVGGMKFEEGGDWIMHGRGISLPPLMDLL